jgi:hypothetical protein
LHIPSSFEELGSILVPGKDSERQALFHFCLKMALWLENLNRLRLNRSSDAAHLLHKRSGHDD